jgi:multiple sugar transport system substrate-binding protein
MKNKKKRIGIFMGFILIINAAVFSLNLLDPFPAGGEYEEGVLRVWATWGDDKDELQPLFDQFTQATGKPVKVATGLKGDQIENALRSQTPPDVLILSSNAPVAALFEQGLIEPLNPWFGDGQIDLDDFYPAPVGQCELPDGTFPCLPWIGDTYALFWNKDMFAAAGLDPERPPQTMEEMLEYAAQLTLKDEDGALIQVGYIPDFPRSHAGMFAHMLGGNWLNSNGTELSVNSQPVIDAFRWQLQFYDLYGYVEATEFVSSINRYMNSSHPVFAGERLNCQQCHRYSPRNGEKFPDQGFYQEKVAMMLDGQWQLGEEYISRYNPELNFGLAPFPAPANDPGQMAVFQGAVVVIPAGSLDKGAAGNLLGWMLSPEIMAETAYVTSSLPTRQGAASDPRFQQDPHYQVFLDVVKAPNTEYFVLSPINEEINSAMADVERVLLDDGGVNLTSLLDELQAEYAPLLRELSVSQNNQ